MRYTIANIYGPNKDAEAVKFYRNLSKLLRNDEFGNEQKTLLLVAIIIVLLTSHLTKKAVYRFLENM